MRTFELNIFIDRPRSEVYNHLSEPINMLAMFVTGKMGFF